MMSRLDDVIRDVGYILDCLMALRNIHQSGCCNDCAMGPGSHNPCGYRPMPGQMVRYNCPFYEKMKEKHERVSETE